jgi:hypothetical protein
MALVSIGHRPDLTPEQAQAAFERHFAGKYKVYPTKARLRDFIVKKTDWAGVGVRLKQEKTGTVFVFTAMMPNLLLQALFGGAIAYLLLRSTWKELENEVRACIEQEFAADQALVRAA